MLKRRSFLHAPARCSVVVVVVGLRLCMIVLTMMWYIIMIAAQKSRRQSPPFILLMPLQAFRTLTVHQSPANELATARD